MRTQGNPTHACCMHWGANPVSFKLMCGTSVAKSSVCMTYVRTYNRLCPVGSHIS